jgi:Domain of unknown function (DUF4167)
MRPGQNKRLRGRTGRKGPNPLTRSFESNGPDVKIRGTAQHVAEKYLQLARDAQSSGDIVMAENLLQHAEHYFRLIAAAQQQNANGYGRQSYETDVDADDDDDFTGVPDRFAPLAERLPSPAYAAGQPSYAPQQPYPQPQPQPQPQAHFAPPQPQPQPYEERPSFGEMRHERPVRQDRPSFGGRGRGGERGHDERGGEGERGQSFNFDRNRERPRFQSRREQPPVGAEQPPMGDVQGSASLPAFITAPPTIAVPSRAARDAPSAGASQEPDSGHEGRVGYHLSSRRRRRPRPMGDEASGESDAPAPGGELPFGE